MHIYASVTDECAFFDLLVRRNRDTLLTVVRIPKYCIRINPGILTTDSRPRPQADAVSDPAIRCQSVSPHLSWHPIDSHARQCLSETRISISVQYLQSAVLLRQHYSNRLCSCAQQVSLPSASVRIRTR